MSNQNKKRLGDLLVEAGLITGEQLAQALQLQRTTGKKLGELLIDEGIVEERQIIEVLELQFGIPHIVLTQQYIEPEVARIIHENLAKRYVLIPIKKERGRLVVAMADPLNIFAIDDVKIATGMEVEPVIATKQEILDAINRYYGKQSAEHAIEEFKKQQIGEQISDIDQDISNDVSNAPVVRLVNSLIKQAVLMKASDIHIEPFDNNIRVRFRVDGELQEILSSAKSTHSAIVTRIKIMGKMDIAERRVPQDGRIEIMVEGREIDLRLSIIPTVYGEKVVMRLLDRSGFLLSRRQVGFTEQNMLLFEKIIRRPNGIVLVTGPTGSGKTTTLYAILRELNQVNKNIITIEDPVEYHLEGVNQVQVNLKAGVNFASGLRSILRQDPDIIMIGEIRDSETAQIAVRAAITGHLVLSTIHTNDTASTVTRLMDMGIDSYLVSSAVVGVIAQRLVRRICDSCKTSYTPSPSEREIVGMAEDIKLYKGTGCNLCNNTGYKGRIAVHEILVVDKDIRLLIDTEASIDKIRTKAQENGTTNLKESCRQLVLSGVTTLDELVRVAYSVD